MPPLGTGETVVNRAALRGGKELPVGGIGLGGILAIIGIVLMVVGYFWIGLIVLLIGLIAFGGFARGRWY